jgi:hypothetical protein
MGARNTRVDPDEGGSEAQAKDFQHWRINNMKKRLSDKPEEMSKHVLVGRLLALEFAAIHASTIAATIAIYELVSAAPQIHHVEELWEDAASALAYDEGGWTLD